jgi:hypothetical protein
MKPKTPHIAALAALACLSALSQTNAATLLTPGAVQVEYTLGEGGLGWAANVQTDASGNGRTMAFGGNDGTWAGGALAPGSSGSIFVNSTSIAGNGGTQAYVMNNTAGMASNFQASIFLSAPDNFGGGNSSLATVFAVGDLRLEAINNPGTNYVYSARIGATSLGSITVGANEAATGLLVQKVGNTFSFWASTNAGTTWTQQGSDLVAPAANIDWTATHLFITPGGGGQYSGYADDFKVVAVVPEPSAALFGGLGMLALLRRRRA